MGRVFLGRPWHWGLLIAASGALWYLGSNRMHVIEFNLFIIGMLTGTAVFVFALIRFHQDGTRVTRDELVAQEFDPDDDGRPARD